MTMTRERRGPPRPHRPDPLDRERLEALPVWAQTMIGKLVDDLAVAQMREMGRRQDAVFKLEGGGSLKVSRRSGTTHSLQLSTDAGYLSIVPVSDRRVQISITPGQQIREVRIGEVEMVIEADPPQEG